NGVQGHFDRVLLHQQDRDRVPPQVAIVHWLLDHASPPAGLLDPHLHLLDEDLQAVLPAGQHDHRVLVLRFPRLRHRHTPPEYLLLGKSIVPRRGPSRQDRITHSSSPKGRPCSMLTRTRPNSFALSGAFTRSVQSTGCSTGQGDKMALIASSPCILAHR